MESERFFFVAHQCVLLKKKPKLDLLFFEDFLSEMYNLNQFNIILSMDFYLGVIWGYHYFSDNVHI